MFGRVQARPGGLSRALGLGLHPVAKQRFLKAGICRRSCGRAAPVQPRALTGLELLGSVGCAYQQCLAQFPLATKALTSGAAYGVGDILAQRKFSKKIDAARLLNFMVSGVGAGVLWSLWYDGLNAFLKWAAVKPGVVSTLISMFSEQFIWCPLFFGFFFLPLSGMLKGHKMDRVMRDVRADIGPTLWGNAKVWTVLNLIIYNLPLDMRAPMGNLGDVIWSAYLSFVIQDPSANTQCEVKWEAQSVQCNDDFWAAQYVPSQKASSYADMVTSVDYTFANSVKGA